MSDSQPFHTDPLASAATEACAAERHSDDVALVANNMNTVLQSNTYRLAHEDQELLNSSEMRGVRMLLEISKPEMVLEAEQISSTILVFGGACLVERVAAQRQLSQAQHKLAEQPDNAAVQRQVKRCQRLVELSPFYEAARDFAHLVSCAQRSGEGCSHVIATGGGPGIMEAANRGAFDAGFKSIGFNISLPHEQSPNPFVTPELCFRFNYFALRKFHFVMRAVGAVFFPGGFGTLDELFEVLTLRQTGIKGPIPVVLFGKDYWQEVINFNALADSGLIADDHLDLIQFADTPSEAWELIRNSDRYEQCRPR